MTGSCPSEDRIILDWLSFTFKSEDGLGLVRLLLGEWTALDRGARGYGKSGKLACGGTVAWAPERPEQGVHVDLSSSQLATLVEQRPYYGDARATVGWLLELGASITRVDIAVDDRSGVLSMGEIAKYLDGE